MITLIKNIGKITLYIVFFLFGWLIGAILPAHAYTSPTFINGASDKSITGTEYFSSYLASDNGVMVFNLWEWDNCGGINIGDTITVNGVPISSTNDTDVNGCEVRNWLVPIYQDESYTVGYSNAGGFTSAAAKMTFISNLVASSSAYNRDGGWTSNNLNNNRNTKYAQFTDGSYWITDYRAVDQDSASPTPFGKQTSLYLITGQASSDISYKQSTSSTEYIRVGENQGVAQYASIETYILPFSPDFGGATSTPPELQIVDQQPFCEGLDAIFTINTPEAYNGYTLYYGFNLPVCSAMATFDGSRRLSIYNLGQAFSTTTTAYGSSTIALCLYLVDSGGAAVSISTEYYDAYASTSDQCAGVYGYEYNYWCDSVCDGLSTTTLGGDFACGLRRFGCWAVYPHPQSQSYFSQAWENLKRSFPFSIYFDITDSFLNFSTSTSETVGFKLPVPSRSPDGSATITMTTLINASTTQNAIGHNNYYQIRQAIIWLAWILITVYILIRLTR